MQQGHQLEVTWYHMHSKSEDKKPNQTYTHGEIDSKVKDNEREK